MKKEFYFLSADKKTNIHGIEWIPQCEVKGIVQICHGMVEYIERYDAFACYLNKKGYYVIGHDQLGHGPSVKQEEDYGFFHKEHGNLFMIEDIHTVRSIACGKNSLVPYFLLGHSMGSFLVRQYIQERGAGVAGAIIMGTGHKPYAFLGVAKCYCKILMTWKGHHYRSKLINHMVMGAFNKHFEPARTPVDWISTDEEIVDAYWAHPWCTFVFTVNGYYNLFLGMQQLTKKRVKNIPKEMQILLISGLDDPVGNFGKEVRVVYDRYRACGLKHVTLKFYEHCRHELLNEKSRLLIFEDIYEWIGENNKNLWI